MSEREVSVKHTTKARGSMTAATGIVPKKQYSLREIYRITWLAALTMMGSRGVPCDRLAAERVMLAVTEVNGCALCSYGHARMALDMGMSDSEVRGLLGGVTADAPVAELPGIAFGQLYADTRGHPEPQAWTDLVEHYGKPRALCVLRAARMMMWGNAMGIPLSSLIARLRGTPDASSSLIYECGTTLGGLVLLPAALTRALFMHWRGAPIEP